jgi:hypothetical protein
MVSLLIAQLLGARFGGAIHIPSGAKARVLFSGICGTTEVVP